MWMTSGFTWKKHPQTECYDHPSPPVVVLVVMDLLWEVWRCRWQLLRPWYSYWASLEISKTMTNRRHIFGGQVMWGSDIETLRRFGGGGWLSDPGYDSSDDLDSRNLKQMIQVGPLESAVKGGDIPKKQGALWHQASEIRHQPSNFHESDRWSRKIWWIAIDGNSRIAVVFYPISCLVNDLIQFIYHMQLIDQWNLHAVFTFGWNDGNWASKNTPTTLKPRSLFTLPTAASEG